MPAVVFDFDGLMVDSEYTIAAAVIDVLAARNVALALDEIAHLFGSVDLDHEWEALLHRRCGPDYTLAHLEAELTRLLPARMDALPLLPGVMDVLDAVSGAGWPVGLATGEERARLDQHLARLGVAERFDAVVTRRDVARGKPYPDIYLATAERLGVAPADCVALEDSIPGCQAAIAAGMTVIVCPSRVTVGCEFPSDARVVSCLTELRLSDLAPS